MSCKTALSLAIAALLAAGAAAPSAAAKSPLEPGEKQPRQCFWTRQVNSFASTDDRIVNIRVGVKDIYQFEMFGPCHDVEWSSQIALRSRGSSYICSGLDAEIIAPSSIGPQRCPVRNIRKLTPEEVEALPKGSRP